mmetsp:Transcript_17066/g.27723  ORF Transcript_17066/g.27723 Transcript_17066/m.27723 type:complete len:214 (+) Transcript_17066:325-966(+)
MHFVQIRTPLTTSRTSFPRTTTTKILQIHIITWSAQSLSTLTHTIALSNLNHTITLSTLIHIVPLSTVRLNIFLITTPILKEFVRLLFLVLHHHWHRVAPTGLLLHSRHHRLILLSLIPFCKQPNAPTTSDFHPWTPHTFIAEFIQTQRGELLLKLGIYYRYLPLHSNQIVRSYVQNTPCQLGPIRHLFNLTYHGVVLLHFHEFQPCIHLKVM